MIAGTSSAVPPRLATLAGHPAANAATLAAAPRRHATAARRLATDFRRLAAVFGRLVMVFGRLGTVAARLGTVFRRLGTVAARLGTVFRRLGTVAARLGIIPRRLTTAKRRHFGTKSPFIATETLRFGATSHFRPLTRPSTFTVPVVDKSGTLSHRPTRGEGWGEGFKPKSEVGLAEERSAGFQTGCVADFQVGVLGCARRAPKFPPAAGLETRDTAGSEACATSP
jgi:hypothetical protein